MSGGRDPAPGRSHVVVGEFGPLRQAQDRERVGGPLGSVRSRPASHDRGSSPNISFICVLSPGVS
jgi:hypothetical protein